jgi:nitroimidazol reductase NimA-like FMN-containing flavoprotein (pyridoxamine 5'-phosphate oxidase superfamily)
MDAGVSAPTRIIRRAQDHESLPKMPLPKRNNDCQIGIRCTARSGFIAMFIHEMTVDECSGALKEMRPGRLACAKDNQPYIVPINFAFDGTYIYGFTTLGQKIEWTRTNPLVCFEVDEVISHNEWMSIVVFGRSEELPDKPEYEKERIRAYACLQKRAMWWEPAYISPEQREQPHSLTPIFFRIHIEKMTGHRATFEKPRADVISAPIVRSHKRGWLKRLINH